MYIYHQAQCDSYNSITTLILKILLEKRAKKARKLTNITYST